MYFIALALLSGMVLAHHLLRHSWYGWIFLFIFSLSSFFWYRCLPWKESCLLGIIFLAGFCHYMYYDLTNQSELPALQKEAIFIGTIYSRPDVNGEWVNFRLKLSTVNGKVVHEMVQCRVRLRSESAQMKAKHLVMGQGLKLAGKLNAPDPPRNPGAFDYPQFLYYQQIHWVVQSSSFSSLHSFSPANMSPLLLLAHLQKLLLNSLDNTFPEASSVLMKGLLLGVRTQMPADSIDTYADLGLIHVLAISGLHLTIIITGVLATLRFIGFTRETSLWLTAFIVPCYVIIAGLSASLIRSGIMSEIVLAGLYLRRHASGTNLWGTALFVMLVINPYQLWDVGFQLSFLVTWGLIVYVPHFKAVLYPGKPSISTVLSVALVAQLISFPVIVYYFRQYDLLSFGVNLLFVPLFSALFIPIGFAAFLLGLLHPGFAYFIALALNKVYAWTEWLLSEINSWKWAHISFGNSPLWWIIVYFAILFCEFFAMKRPKLLFCWMAAIISVACIPLLLNHPGQKKVVITFLDVGQGDAIVVQTPHNVYLIDGGAVNGTDAQGPLWTRRRDLYDNGKKVILPFLRFKGINSIDTMIATHGDSDHIGGLQSVIKHIDVKRFLENGKTPQSIIEQNLMGSVQKAGIWNHQAYRGMHWKEDDQIRWTVLNPQDHNLKTSDNNSSIVVLLEVFHYKILLTADLERSGEQQCLNACILPEIDVLKVGHHGSRSSSSEEWIQKLRPVISIISAGRNNRFGHPHTETLNTLKKYGSQVFRTDQQGAITVEITERNLLVKTFMQQEIRNMRQ